MTGSSILIPRLNGSVPTSEVFTTYEYLTSFFALSSLWLMRITLSDISLAPFPLRDPLGI